jgi:hypothetical protein
VVLPRRASCRRAKITVKGAPKGASPVAMAQAPPLTLIFHGKSSAYREDGELWVSLRVIWVTDWWADSAAWATAVGTGAAAFVALYIANRGWTIAANERADREAVQARQVVISPSEGALRITNHSSLPIADLRVWEDSWPGAAPIEPLEKVSVGANEQGAWTTLLAGESVEIKFRRPGDLEYLPGSNPNSLAIRFRDAAGLEWQRRGNNRVLRVLKDQPQSNRIVRAFRRRRRRYFG